MKLDPFGGYPRSDRKTKPAIEKLKDLTRFGSLFSLVVFFVFPRLRQDDFRCTKNNYKKTGALLGSGSQIKNYLPFSCHFKFFQRNSTTSTKMQHTKDRPEGMNNKRSIARFSLLFEGHSRETQQHHRPAHF